MTRHLFPQSSTVPSDRRVSLLGHRGGVVWLTGLSGSGKSTIAYALEAALVNSGVLAYVLDGDNVRRGLCSDLGFSPADRAENIRRVGHIASLMAGAGLVAITAFISPYIAGRMAARDMADACGFFQVHIDAPLEVCESRDPKGLYRRARAGELAEFTGVSAPYEAPKSPELRLATDVLTPAECVNQIIDGLMENGWIGKP